MESHKSLIQKGEKAGSSLQNAPTSSMPLQKSIAKKLTLSALISENDDETERITRQCAREMHTSTPLSTTIDNRRHSLGLGLLANISTPQKVERIRQCIKLRVENKMNIKNAFSLEMIDFMTHMIKKQQC